MSQQLIDRFDSSFPQGYLSKSKELTSVEWE